MTVLLAIWPWHIKGYSNFTILHSYSLLMPYLFKLHSVFCGLNEVVNWLGITVKKLPIIKAL